MGFERLKWSEKSICLPKKSIEHYVEEDMERIKKEGDFSPILSHILLAFFHGYNNHSTRL